MTRQFYSHALTDTIDCEINIETIQYRMEKRLIERYKKNNVWKPLFYSHETNISFSLDKSFIHIGLTPQKNQEKTEKKLLKTDDSISGSEQMIRDQHFNSWETLHLPTHPILIEDLFIPLPDENFPIKKILLQGRAGIGKSLLAQYLTYRWTEGKLWKDKFKAVFLIPLRALVTLVKELVAEEKKITVEAIIYHFCLFQKNDEEKINVIEEFETCLKNKEKILLILDGWDEITSHEKDKHIAPVLSSLLSFPSLLITTRPHSTPTLKNDDNENFKPDRSIEHMGFNPDSLPTYIKNFFKVVNSDQQEEKAQKLQEFIEKNRCLKSLMLIPIQAELVCSLWDDASDKNEIFDSPLSFSTLYAKLVPFIIRRYLAKREKDPISEEDLDLMTESNIEQTIRPLLNVLEKIAYQGMAKESLTLLTPYEDISDLLEGTGYTIKDLLALQFIKGIGAGKFNSQDYYFIHLTFQEYFAARYLVQELASNNNDNAYDWIRFNKYNARYSVLFWFLAGLTSKIPKASQRFWDAIQDEPRECIGFHHTELIMRCAEEAYRKDKKGQLPPGFPDTQLKAFLKDIPKNLEWLDEKFRIYPILTNPELHWIYKLRYTPKLCVNYYAFFLKTWLENIGIIEIGNRFFFLVQQNLLPVCKHTFFEKRIIPYLEHKDSNIRDHAIFLFGKWIESGNASEELITNHLIPFLKNNPVYELTSAFNRWMEIGEVSEKFIRFVLEELLVKLENQEDDIIPKESRLITQWMKRRQSPQWLIEELLSKQNVNCKLPVRGTTGHILYKWIKRGHAPESFIKEYLLQHFDSEDEYDKAFCYLMLHGWMISCKPPKELVENYITKGLKDESENIRALVTANLNVFIGEYEPSEKFIETHLVRSLENKDPGPRQLGTRGLPNWIKMSQNPQILIKKYLLPRIEDENDYVRQEAKERLRQCFKTTQFEISEKFIEDDILPLLKKNGYHRFTSESISGWIENHHTSETSIKNIIRIMLSDNSYSSEFYEEISTRIAQRNEKYTISKTFFEEYFLSLFPLMLKVSKVLCETDMSSFSLTFSCHNILSDRIRKGLLSEQFVEKNLVPHLQKNTESEFRKMATNCIKQWIENDQSSEKFILDTVIPNIRIFFQLSSPGSLFFLMILKKTKTESKESFLSKHASSIVDCLIKDKALLLITGNEKNKSEFTLDIKIKNSTYLKDYSLTEEEAFLLKKLLWEKSPSRDLITQFKKEETFMKKMELNDDKDNNFITDTLSSSIQPKITTENHPLRQRLVKIENILKMYLDSFEKDEELSLEKECQNFCNSILKQLLTKVEKQINKFEKLNFENEGTKKSAERIAVDITNLGNSIELYIATLRETDTATNIRLILEAACENISATFSESTSLYDFSEEEEIGLKESQLKLSQECIHKFMQSKEEVGQAFEGVLKNIGLYMQENNRIYSCFISYAWPLFEKKGPDYWVQDFLKILRSHLLTAGINAKLDYLNVTKGDNIEKYMQKLKNDNHCLLIGTPSLTFKWLKGTNVRFELEILEKHRIVNKEKLIFPMIPILVCGSYETSLPWYTNQRSGFDFTKENYVKNLKDLLQALTHIPEKIYQNFWKDFEEKYPEWMKPIDKELVKKFKLLEDKNKKIKEEVMMKNMVSNMQKLGLFTEEKKEKDKKDDIKENKNMTFN